MSYAGITNANVTSLTEVDYSNIWFGISNGGYQLLAARGSEFVFRVFVKNGMSDRSLNNVLLHTEQLPFQVNKVTPLEIDQLKPMEIGIFWINVTIPEDAQVGIHPLSIDVSSDEFPVGVFRLGTQITVKKRIPIELYVFYACLTLALIIFTFVRKRRIDKT